MTDTQNTQHVVVNDDNKNTASTEPAKSKKVDSRPIGSRLVKRTFMWLLVIVLLGVAAYGLWQFWLMQNARISDQTLALQQQTDSVAKTTQEQSARLQQQLTEQQKQLALFIQQSSSEQQILQQRLDAQLAKINTLSGVSRDGWMLEEARHLLRLANQRQLTGSNVSGIVGLLTSADSLLMEIDRPDIFPIRERIKNDLLALKLAPVVDREGIYLQLAAVINQVEKLPAAPLTSSLVASNDSPIKDQPNNSLSTVDNNAPPSTWWDRMIAQASKAFDHLDSYVRITHHDQALEPILSDTQQRITQENLRLMLEQTQTALLREESVIYQQSIAKAIEWLNKHYGHYPQKAAMVILLTELQNQTIVVDLPAISTSLHALSQYIDIQGTAASTAEKKSSPVVKEKEVKKSETLPKIEKTSSEVTQ